MNEKINDAVEIGTDILEEIPEVHVDGKNKVVTIVVATVLTAGVAYGVYRYIKYRRKKKGIIEGEILDPEVATE